MNAMNLIGTPLQFVKVNRLRELGPGDVILVVEDDPQNSSPEDREYSHAWIDVVRLVHEREANVRYDRPVATLRTEGDTSPDDDPIYEDEDKGCRKKSLDFSAAGGYHPAHIWILKKKEN